MSEIENKPLLQGQRFGKLTVIKLDHTEIRYRKNGVIRRRYMYLCKCDCGNEKIFHKVDLLAGTKSCGCIKKDTFNSSRFKPKEHLLTYNGETHCITKWAEKIGIKRVTLGKRIEYGWSVEKALTTPIMIKRR